VVEVLVPDFQGSHAAMDIVLEARPDVLNHNTETVPRLFPRMRAKGDFGRSMQLLARADAYRRDSGADMVTKSGVIVGLGETLDELLETMDHLRSVNCDVLTLGQYLNPTTKHAPIDRFYTPAEFELLEREGRARGFAHVESGPLVRSSYHAHEHVPAR
jgi:lipoic acid synthetase